MPSLNCNSKNKMKEKRRTRASWPPALCAGHLEVATLPSNTKKKVEQTQESTALLRTEKQMRSQRKGCPGNEETGRKSQLPQVELSASSQSQVRSLTVIGTSVVTQPHGENSRAASAGDTLLDPLLPSQPGFHQDLWGASVENPLVFWQGVGKRHSGVHQHSNQTAFRGH